MTQLIRLHISLFRFLKVELRKKRTLKELILFLKKIGISYYRTILQLYKSIFLIFDPNYRKQKKQYKHYQEIKKDIVNATKLLLYVDNKMKKAGISRQIRRRFFLELGKSPEKRQELVDELMKEIK